jgi:hypothetical protein
VFPAKTLIFVLDNGLVCLIFKKSELVAGYSLPIETLSVVLIEIDLLPDTLLPILKSPVPEDYKAYVVPV